MDSNNTTTTVTFHGVLAGAYKGKRANLKATLIHASIDGGRNAMCGKVTADNLCDWNEPAATCPACLKKVEKSGLPTAPGRSALEGL